jgi:hypothetical protein
MKRNTVQQQAAAYERGRHSKADTLIGIIGGATSRLPRQRAAALLSTAAERLP